MDSARLILASITRAFNLNCLWTVLLVSFWLKVQVNGWNYILLKSSTCMSKWSFTHFLNFKSISFVFIWPFCALKNAIHSVYHTNLYKKKVIRHYKLRETARHNLTVEIQFWYQPQFSTVEPLLSSHPPGHVRQPLNRGLSGIRTELGWNINLINYKHTWMLYDL